MPECGLVLLANVAGCLSLGVVKPVVPVAALCGILGCAAFAQEAAPLPGAFETADLQGFDELPEPVRKVLARAAELSRMRLGYKFGSANPDAGGMDCSGTIQRLLRDAGFPQAPRQSDAIYRWVWQDSRVYPVLGVNDKTFELDRLRPGDLLFWTGTYKVERAVPISHVMLYLGALRGDKRPVMFGASDGRTFEGRSRFGVGVFDFLEPRTNAGPARFVGYGPVPGIADAAGTATRGKN